MTSFKFEKAVQALNFFAKKEGYQINYMKAGKLVYLADKVHLRMFGRTITNDNYVAMKNGPVPSRTKDIISKSSWSGNDIVEYSNKFLTAPNGYNISSIGDIDYGVFSKTDIKVLDLVYQEFGKLNEFDLSDYTHTFPEWLKYKKALASDPSTAFPIEIDDLFSIDENDNAFNQSEELLSLSKKQYYRQF
ncbi:MAG: SocA family protein [Bacteroidetes bacterium]|jgi:uncharacterized phage-associated protein|nr:SocA family protein [Bacteroidota bacterium]